MSARAIASLSLTFGLVSIPVKLYSATEKSAAIRFKLMGPGGSRLRQQYVADTDEPLFEPATDIDTPSSSRDAQRTEPAPERFKPEPQRLKLVDNLEVDARPIEPVHAAAPVERADMVKGYEFERGKFVLFTPSELKALQASSRQTIDIVSFIPQHSVEPIYYDKAYFLAPDKRGAQAYSLLLAAMRAANRCAIAKWAWRSKEYVVQVRPSEGALVLQQLLYADEVRSPDDIGVELVDVGEAELKLALQLIAQVSEDAYDPSKFVDEEKQRILDAVEEKIAGRQIVAPSVTEPRAGQIIDLMAALRASLQPTKSTARASPKPVVTRRASEAGERKPAARRAATAVPGTPAAKSRSRK